MGKVVMVVHQQSVRWDGPSIPFTKFIYTHQYSIFISSDLVFCMGEGDRRMGKKIYKESLL
jgi:hypothetical protein